MDLTWRRQKEKEMVSLMIHLFCQKKHRSKSVLCPQCQELEDYSFARIDHYPFMETKTFCSNCKVHCYKPAMREQIRGIMRYAGPRMMFHHPILAIAHLVSTKTERRKQKK